MKGIFQKLSVLTAVSLLGFGVMKTDSAQAATFNFTQGGFEGGGTLSGTFTGEDLNNDGFIDNGFRGGPNELSAFSVSLSGSSILGSSVSASLADTLIQFRYVIGAGAQGFSASAGGTFLVVATNIPGISVFAIATGTGTSSIGGGGVSVVAEFTSDARLTKDGSLQPLLVSEVTSKSVPEPNISAVAGLTVLGLSAFLKRRVAL